MQSERRSATTAWSRVPAGRAGRPRRARSRTARARSWHQPLGSNRAARAWSCTTSPASRFPVQLSRELARRGHQRPASPLPLATAPARATSSCATTTRDPRDRADSMGAPFDKYSPANRLRQELTYGRPAGRRIRGARPDVVLSGDTPLFAQSRRSSAPVGGSRSRSSSGCRTSQRRHALEAKRRLPLAETRLRAGARGLERKALMSSYAVVAISEDFRTTLLAVAHPGAADPRDRELGPLDDLPLRPRENAWARSHGLDGKPVLLYCGRSGSSTILPAAPARGLAPSGRVVVASEGLGADWLRERPLDNLRLARVPALRRAARRARPPATSSLVILEREAGTFAVPSKVLSYLCAGRPLLAALPHGQPRSQGDRVQRRRRPGGTGRRGGADRGGATPVGG